MPRATSLNSHNCEIHLPPEHDSICEQCYQGLKSFLKDPFNRIVIEKDISRNCYLCNVSTTKNDLLHSKCGVLPVSDIDSVHLENDYIMSHFIDGAVRSFLETYLKERFLGIGVLKKWLSSLDGRELNVFGRVFADVFHVELFCPFLGVFNSAVFSGTDIEAAREQAVMLLARAAKKSPKASFISEDGRLLCTFDVPLRAIRGRMTSEKLDAATAFASRKCIRYATKVLGAGEAEAGYIEVSNPYVDEKKTRIYESDVLLSYVDKLEERARYEPA